MRRFFPLVFVVCSGFLACAQPAPAAEQPDAETARLVRTGEIPCEPRAVLARVCRQCHSEPLRNDAPFAMDTYSEIDADLDGQPVFAWMRAAIDEGRMPLAPWALTATDRTTLLDWLAKDAPPAPLGTVCR